MYTHYQHWAAAAVVGGKWSLGESPDDDSSSEQQLQTTDEPMCKTPIDDDLLRWFGWVASGVWTRERRIIPLDRGE